MPKSGSCPPDADPRSAFNEVNVLALISILRRWGLRNVNMVKKNWTTGLKMRECLCVLNHFLKSLASKKTFFTSGLMCGICVYSNVYFSFWNVCRIKFL